MKSKRSKTKSKGVRYIAKALKKYRPGQFKTQKSALPKAKLIFAELKSSGKPVRITTILEASKGGGRKKRTKPEVDPAMLVEINYFNLTDYPVYISRSDSEITFISKITPSALPEFKGGSIVDYSEYFAPFVNFCNGLKNATSPEDRVYETEWLVVTTEPVYSKSRKRWESEIISVDGNGNKNTYGFDPKEPYLKPGDEQKAQSEVSISKKESRQGEAAKTQKEDKDIVAKKIEARKVELDVEKARQENIAQALKLYGEGLLSKQEFKDLMAQIKR